MNIAILTVSSLGLAASAGSLLVMLKMAKELKKAKVEIEQNVRVAKADFAHKSAVVKAAIEELGL